MVIGVGKITWRLHACRSLKAKRVIVKAIISRLRNKFNIAAAEVAANDNHQKALIGFAIVGNDSKLINSRMDKILNFVDSLGLAEVLDSEMEIISL